MKERLGKLREMLLQLFKNNSKIVKIVVAILGILLVLFIISCITKKTHGNETGNLYNGGMVVKSGSWIYYTSPTNDGIYRSKGSKSEKLTSDTGMYLNIDGNYIYYVKYNEENNQYDLIKMKTNGEESETLVENIDEDVAVTVANNWIYYSKSGNFTRCNKKGEDKLTISKNDILKYQISGNKIFYSYVKDDKNYIAEMKLNGDNNEKIARLDISSEGSFADFYVKGNKIYYILRKYDSNYDLTYSLHSINANGEKDMEIRDLSEEIVSINMTENALYYISLEDDTYEIRKIDYKGKKDEKIVETNIASNLNIMENYLVYADYNDEEEATMFMMKTNGKDKKEL